MSGSAAIPDNLSKYPERLYTVRYGDLSCPTAKYISSWKTYTTNPCLVVLQYLLIYQKYHTDAYTP